MSQTGDDMNVLNTIWSGIRGAYESVAWIFPFLIPALLGTLARAHGIEQRKMTKTQWLSAVVWTAIIGAGLAPLAAHYSGAPDRLIYPIAFFLGIIAYEKTNSIAGLLKRFKQVKDTLVSTVTGEQNDGSSETK